EESLGREEDLRSGEEQEKVVNVSSSVDYGVLSDNLPWKNQQVNCRVKSVHETLGKVLTEFSEFHFENDQFLQTKF
ncbi:MAG TPA: hypothetical protein DDW21_07130, partial [Verrucomicrobiales bacterium]|nr:hypothetical protein [Verrucomicrobiales bacterium]